MPLEFWSRLTPPTIETSKGIVATTLSSGGHAVASPRQRDAHVQIVAVAGEAGGNIRCEMVLADEGGSGKVAEVERFHLRRLRVGIFERLLSGFDGERAQVAIGERAEVGFADADDGYLSHTFKITRRLCRSRLSGSRV